MGCLMNQLATPMEKYKKLTRLLCVVSVGNQFKTLAGVCCAKTNAIFIAMEFTGLYFLFITSNASKSSQHNIRDKFYQVLGV